jgi:hypothetical protein
VGKRRREIGHVAVDGVVEQDDGPVAGETFRPGHRTPSRAAEAAREDEPGIGIGNDRTPLLDVNVNPVMTSVVTPDGLIGAARRGVVRWRVLE